LQTLKGGKPLKAKKATPSVDFDPAGTSTKVNVHTDKSVDMHTNVQMRRVKAIAPYRCHPMECEDI
jgi:hypothetical protein